MPHPEIYTPIRLTVLLTLLCGCAFLLFFRIPEVGARALRTGPWAPLQAGKTNFVLKPPITVWGNALGMALLGENELGGRLTGIARVRGESAGQQRLFVLDLCGGRFASVQEWPE